MDLLYIMAYNLCVYHKTAKSYWACSSLTNSLFAGLTRHALLHVVLYPVTLFVYMHIIEQKLNHPNVIVYTMNILFSTEIKYSEIHAGNVSVKNSGEINHYLNLYQFDSGNGLVPSGNKPLPEPTLAML